MAKVTGGRVLRSKSVVEGGITTPQKTQKTTMTVAAEVHTTGGFYREAAQPQPQQPAVIDILSSDDETRRRATRSGTGKCATISID